MEKEVKARVPALEKGLDILEMMAERGTPLSQKEIADGLGRTVSEVFRVIGVLERRGFLMRRENDGRYEFSLKMFEMAHIHPPDRRLLERAYPIMDGLADAIGFSCHLVIRRGDNLVVFAQSQPNGLLMGWSVKTGASFKLSSRITSARVFLAFQPEHRMDELLETLGETDALDRAFHDRIARIRANGHEIADSIIAPGIVDVSTPVLNGFGSCSAVLTASCVAEDYRGRDAERVVGQIRQAAAAISRNMGMV